MEFAKPCLCNFQPQALNPMNGRSTALVKAQQRLVDDAKRHLISEAVKNRQTCHLRGGPPRARARMIGGGFVKAEFSRRLACAIDRQVVSHESHQLSRHRQRQNVVASLLLAPRTYRSTIEAQTNDLRKCQARRSARNGSANKSEFAAHDLVSDYLASADVKRQFPPIHLLSGQPSQFRDVSRVFSVVRRLETFLARQNGHVPHAQFSAWRLTMSMVDVASPSASVLVPRRWYLSRSQWSDGDLDVDINIWRYCISLQISWL